MFSIPQTVLKQLLSMKNTTPERLSQQETEIATRIMHCTLCDSLWIRRKRLIPDRCPKCHKRGWDRPLLAAMLSASTLSPQPQPSQDKKEDR